VYILIHSLIFQILNKIPLGSPGFAGKAKEELPVKGSPDKPSDKLSHDGTLFSVQIALGWNEAWEQGMILGEFDQLAKEVWMAGIHFVDQFLEVLGIGIASGLERGQLAKRTESGILHDSTDHV
jgi:hypothetical protein